MAAHLSGSKINLSFLRETYRKELLDCLDKCTGSKAVVWDETLTGPFGLIAEYSLLKEHDVEKMYSLKAGHLPQSTVQNIVFIIRPKVSVIDLVGQNVLWEEEKGGSSRKEFHIIFVPRKSLLCEKRLKELNVYGAFSNIEEFCLDLIPFDSDLLSMELDQCYKDCTLFDDNTSLYHVAKSIMTLQALYGIIPSIHGKGDGAKHVSEMIIRMRRQLASHETQVPSQIDTLLLIDREIDPLTPLLSQLTYEGLIDDIFNINNTSVRLPADKFTRSSPDGQNQQPATSSSETKKVILNSGEELYAEIRDRNFNAVGPILSRKAKLISAQFDERLSAKTVGEMKQFVSKLPHIQAAKQSLATHTTIAELLKEVTDSDDFLECLRVQQEFINGIDTDKAHTYIEDCIAKQEPLNKILRLMCIQSVTNNGLKQKLLDYYRREILQTYGFQHLLTLMNLEKAGLLKLQGQRTYPTIRKTLKLVVEDVHEQKPNDISYVFSGFAPLSVRLAQFLARPGWRSIEEVLNMLPGQRTHRIQQIADGLRKRRNSTSSSHSSAQEQTVTLIFFLGGVTYAEIAALRFLSQADDGPTEYLIATTKIINSENFLGTLREELNPPASNPFYN